MATRTRVLAVVAAAAAVVVAAVVGATWLQTRGETPTPPGAAAWPKDSLDTVKQLVAANPRSPVAQLHLALALYWSGRNADAVKAFHQVYSRFPDSPSSVAAENILYA